MSSRAGISSHIGKGMSAAVADFDHDGFIDLFVTNDTVPDFLFRNKGDGTFEEIGLLAGVSVPASGRPVSSMGVDFQDYDNDGWEDIFVTALAGETFPLFHNDGRREFTETTTNAGLAMSSARLSGWCAATVDVDNDGWKDLFTANSHANDRVSESSGWNQPNSLWLNDGRGHFRDVSSPPASPPPRPRIADVVSPISTATAVSILRCLSSKEMRNSGTTRPPHRTDG